jgi:hypothetical protein
MGAVVQMIQITEDDSLFLYGVNDKNELIFRTTHNPALLRNEPFIVKKHMIYVGEYFFHENYLNKVIKENEAI